MLFYEKLIRTYGYLNMESIKIVILLFDSIAALDAVGPYEVLSKIPGAKVCFVSLEARPVKCAGGLTLVADYSIEDIQEADVMVIPGGRGIDRLLHHNELLAWVQAIHKTTRYTVSVCTGSLLLGAAGLLNGMKATSHWLHIEKLKEYGAEPLKERYVVEGKIITSAGVSAGIDIALELVRLIKNETLAKAIQLAIEYDPSPPFDAGAPHKASKELVQMVRAAYTRNVSEK
jgi:transcriptional regulator GlxA family with amidase domain